MNRTLAMLALLLSLSPMAAVTAVELADSEIVAAVEHTHQQLDRWTSRLMYRLERGAGPRQSDPLLDGRAQLMVTKLRDNYASAVKSRKLAVAIHHLADAHEQRLRALDMALRQGVDTRRLHTNDERIAAAFRELAALRN